MSCEIVPLEHDWFSILSTHFTIFRRLREPLNSVLSGLHWFDCGWSWILLRHCTESEKTYSLAVESLTAVSFTIPGIVDIPYTSWRWSLINFCEISNNCLICSKPVFWVVCQLSWQACPRCTAAFIVAGIYIYIYIQGVSSNRRVLKQLLGGIFNF